MNWFKKLFGVGDKMETDYNGLPKVWCDIPMPKVKPCKPEKDISEPVYAMVQSMFDRPHTWKVKYSGGYHITSYYLVRDIKTDFCFDVTGTYNAHGEIYRFSYATWMTLSEQIYLLDSLRTMHKSLKETRIKRMRKVKEDIARNKVKELYL